MSFSSAALLALAFVASWPLRCGTVFLTRIGLRSASEQHGQACTELVNHGVYFTVDVEVGTPGQKFNVVADTGSNTLIVPSCLCKTCSSRDRCFTGTGHSSTFSMVNRSDGGPQSLALSFGSGKVQGVLARDVVRVGALQEYMGDGLMLMTSKAFSFATTFEGILGLGLPRSHKPPKKQAPVAQLNTSGNGAVEAFKAIIEQLTHPKPPELIMPEIGSESGGLDAYHDLDIDNPSLQPGGFLEQAGIARFSICFNEGANGVLRIGTPQVPDAHRSVGKAHWGLDLRGVSVGKHRVLLSICSPESMTKGQQTACGAIPDTGSTLIMAPHEHLSELLEALCDGWDRCRQEHAELARAAAAASEAAAKPASKRAVLEFLLQRCESWLDKGSGLGELPPIHFQVAGTNGTKQTLTLNGFDYILATAQGNTSGQRTKVCRPAFKPHTYLTSLNGPIWILGTPLFYQFNVGYDLSTVPASISFIPTSETPCGTCDKKAGLVVASASPAYRRSPHWLDGQPRMPSIDINSPL